MSIVHRLCGTSSGQTPNLRLSTYLAGQLPSPNSNTSVKGSKSYMGRVWLAALEYPSHPVGLSEFSEEGIAQGTRLPANPSCPAVSGLEAYRVVGRR